jgi:uncharacterized zinc-type alcohol dehydrogenase-like protein
MLKAVGYGARRSFGRLKIFEFEREEAKACEVEIAVLYCGVCHSDIHQVKNEWSNTVYPCVPGHEIVGRVTRVGENVTQHAVGDTVGVGCMIDSCRHCGPCKAFEENYCEGPNGWLATYNGPMVPAEHAPGGRNTYRRDNTFGGYSNLIVVNQDFVLKIPAALKPEEAAPILCAGVTTWSPLRRWNVSAGDRVGIIGFGGLGNMAAKLAKARGADVTVFTTNHEKIAAADAMRFKAVLESDKKAMQALASSFDFMLSTVPEKHDVNPFVQLLKRDCTLVVVGALEPLAPINNQELAFRRRTVAGSLIGSLAETQEVLDFCAEHGIAPDIEIIDIKTVNEAYRKVEKGDVRFRYVIDMSTLHADAAG